MICSKKLWQIGAGFDEKERETKMKGIREKNVLEFWDIMWGIIVCNKVY